MSFVSEYRLSA